MKKIGIACSSEAPNLEVPILVSSVVDLLLEQNDYSFVMGYGNTGLMQMVKEKINEEGAYLEEIYMEKDNPILSIADSKIAVESTFDRTKEIYKRSDIIIFLPGGSGTESEFKAMFQEKQENGGDTELILYNEDRSYNDVIAPINNRIKTGFNNRGSIHNFKVVYNKDELKAVLNIKDKERGDSNYGK